MKTEKTKRSVDEWVKVAKEFGDKCQAIQHDQKLSVDQKLQKQEALSKEILKEIENDPHLKSDEKKTMKESVNFYMEDWSEMHDLMMKTTKGESKKKK